MFRQKNRHPSLLSATEGIRTPRGGGVGHRRLYDRPWVIIGVIVALVSSLLLWWSWRLPSSLSSRADLSKLSPEPPATGSDEVPSAGHRRPTIYFVVTTSIKTTEGETDVMTRKMQYHRGIMSLINATNHLFHQDSQQQELYYQHQVVIVENNGHRPTYLDNFKSLGAKVIYTNNNDLKIEKGEKELRDVQQCIHQLGMDPQQDVIVKMTGRYYLEAEAPSSLPPFFELVRQHLLQSPSPASIQAILKFGSYDNPSDVLVEDCITGLILLPVSLFLQMPQQCDATYQAGNPMEWTYAICVLNTLEEPSRFHAIQGKMGLWIAPAGAEYRMV